MKRFFFFTFYFLLLTATARAAVPPLEHFARGYRLQVDGQSAIYRLPLPEEVYRTVVRSDLGDVRVFNSKGEAVPHAVREPEQVETRRAVRTALPFFPVTVDVDDLNADKNVDIMVDNDGTIIHIKSRGGEYVAENADITGYVIDLSALKHNIDELEFDITGNNDGYIKQVSLYSSDNLNDWQPYVSNATLAELDYAGHSLEKNRIKLPNRKAKYLRLDWRGNGNGLRVKAVHAALTTVHTSHERSWSEVAGLRSEDDEQAIEFDTGGLFPIDRIEVVLHEDNTLIDTVLSSRRDKKAPWRVRYSGLFYKLQIQGSHLKPEPVSVGFSKDRYWQLRVKTRDGMGSRLPVFRFAWSPNDLYFLARGDAPFTLAYGNGRIGAPGRPIDALMKVLGDERAGLLSGEAQLGKPVTLLGNDALKPELEIPWQRILLWAVLVFGVMVIGFMAFRLFKQMNAA